MRIPIPSEGLLDGGCPYGPAEMELMRQRALAPYWHLKIEDFITLAAEIPRMTKESVVLWVSVHRNLTIDHARGVVERRWPA